MQSKCASVHPGAVAIHTALVCCQECPPINVVMKQKNQKQRACTRARTHQTASQPVRPAGTPAARSLTRFCRRTRRAATRLAAGTCYRLRTPGPGSLPGLCRLRRGTPGTLRRCTRRTHSGTGSGTGCSPVCSHSCRLHSGQDVRADAFG